MRAAGAPAASLSAVGAVAHDGLLEQLPAGVAVLHPEGAELRVGAANRAFEGMFADARGAGRPAGRLVGEVLREPVARRVARAAARALATGRPVPFAHNDGSHRWTGSVGPVTLPDGCRAAAVTIVEAGTDDDAAGGVAARLRDESRRRDELETLLASITDGVSFHDVNGRVMYLNEAGRALLGGLGLREEDLIRRTREALVDARGRPLRTDRLPFRRAVLEARVVREELVLQRRAGSSGATLDIRLQVVASPVIRDGRITGAVVVFRDVTHDARHARRRLRAIADVALRLGNTTDPGTIFDSALRAALELADARIGLIYLAEGGRLRRAATRGAEPALANAFDSWLERPGDVHGEAFGSAAQIRVADGGSDQRFLESFPRPLAREIGGGLVVPIRAHGDCIGVLSAWRDLPGELPEADAVFIQAVADQAGLALMSTRLLADAGRARGALIQAQEQERRMIAADLHDGVMQEIAAAAVTLGAAQRFLDDGDLETAAELYRRESLRINEAAQALRGVLYDLRPQDLDQHGLVHAVRTLAMKLADEAGVELALDLALDERPGPVLEVTIYRFVQEALSNVRKHAHARAVKLRVARDGDDVLVSVRDDGRGFSVPSVPDQLRSSCFGLRGMRERVEGAGGTFTIRSWPGDGTLVEARLRWSAGES